MMATLAAPRTGPLCTNCGAPFDAQHFDDVRFDDAPEQGRTVILARVELARQYCGRLEGFSQFTEQFAREPFRVETPTLEWTLRLNGRPLAPYFAMRALLHPWGEWPYALAISLDEGSVVELVVRGVPSNQQQNVGRVGGRLMGRYWFNELQGAALRPR
jgi:hypothetical protein